MINVNIMNPGDSVLEINEKFLAIKRKDNTVDIYNVNSDEFYVDPIKTATIGFGDGTIEKLSEDGITNIIDF